ncbi:MAG: peptidylprolyl isomerase, partial [Bacteroidota bacterium]
PTFYKHITAHEIGTGDWSSDVDLPILKRLLIFSILLSCFAISCTVQKTSTTSDKPLFTIEDQAVSAEEFKYAFLKNYKPSDTVSVAEEVKDYQDLYINFKLKVKEARSLGYHERDKYVRELASYQKELAEPYLTEKKVTEELIQEAYERMKDEVKASHILIGTKGDSVAAKKKILEVKALADKGLSFDSLASVYSTDPSAKNNGGNLGYFSAMQMVYPFESAAFSTPVGTISDIVTTRFGYHILKVYDRRPSKGKVKVAHIMLRNSPNATEDQIMQQEQKINAIYAEIKEGKNWNQLVKDFSQDARSSNNGGELPWISTGNFVPEFEKVAFGLSEPNDVSEPFKTIYGWHIVKLLEKKGLGPLDEVRDEISRRIERDSRSQIKNKEVIKRLKAENEFSANPSIIDQVIQQLDQNDTSNIDRGDVLFTLKGNPTTAGDFVDYLKESDVQTKNQRDQYNRFEKNRILEFESDQLEVKYPDYANLLNEYRDGILLFDIMNEKVWMKASSDTTGLKKYYENNKSRYTRYNVTEAVIFSSTEAEVISNVKAMLAENISREDIMKKINADAPLLLQSKEGSFEKGDNAMVDEAADGPFYETRDGEKYILVQVKNKFAEQLPKMKSIKGRLIADYQDYLEAAWIKDLKSKYTIEKNEKVLNKVINEISNR